MAFALTIVVDGSAARTGLALPSVVLDGASTRYGVSLSALLGYSYTRNGLALTGPYLTNQGPISTTYTVDGGVKVTGAALKSAVLNGVPTFDTTVYDIATSGGAAVGGLSTSSTIIGYEPGHYVTVEDVPGYWDYTGTTGDYTFVDPNFDAYDYSDDFYFTWNVGLYWWDYDADDYVLEPLATLVATYGDATWNVSSGSGTWVPPVTHEEWVEGAPIYADSDTIVFKLTSRSEYYPLGGAKLSGAATVTTRWTRAPVTFGGIKLGGAATVASKNGVSGTLSATLPQFSSAFTQNVIGLAATLPSLTASLGPEGNTLGVSLPALTADLGPESSSVGSINATLPALTLDVTPVIGSYAAITAELPLFVVDVEGGARNISVELPALTGDISGNTAVVAEVEAQLPTITGSLAGLVAVAGTVGVTLPPLTSNLSAFYGAVASLAARLPSLASASTGSVGVTASVDITLPALRGYVGSYTLHQATMDIVLPAVSVSLQTQVASNQLAVYIVNTLTNAVSTYENFEFNSFATINGKYYAAGPNGLFLLEGGTDDTAPINARIKTGTNAFGSEMQKRVSDFYAGMRSEGNLTLRVYVDEQEPFEYTLSPEDIELLKQRRSLIGKGARGKYWQFEIENQDGAYFDFDSFNVAAVQTARRI